MRAAALLLALALAGCAAPVRDICAESVDTWVSGGYGDAQGQSETTGVLGETRDTAEAWDMRAGFSIHWDLTGSCWDYGGDEVESHPPGSKPGDPKL